MNLWHAIVRAEHAIERALGLHPPADPADDGGPAPQTSPAASSPSAASGDDPIVGPAFPWLARWTPAERRALLDAQLAIGFDPARGALLAVIDHESGGDPTVPKSATGTPRGGLIQLTAGANLPGFRTAADVWAVRAMPIAEQLDRVVVPLYRRSFPSGPPQDGVALLRRNFLPALASKHASFVLGVREGATGPSGETADDRIGGTLTRGAIFRANPGFAHGRDYFTWADVDASAAQSVARGSHGFMRVSGATTTDPALAGGTNAAVVGKLTVSPTGGVGRRRGRHHHHHRRRAWDLDPLPVDVDYGPDPVFDFGDDTTQEEAMPDVTATDAPADPSLQGLSATRIDAAPDAPATTLPVGYVGMSQAHVTPERAGWAKALLHDQTFQLGQVRTRDIGGPIAARVETHPADRYIDHPHRGISLYEQSGAPSMPPSDDATPEPMLAGISAAGPNVPAPDVTGWDPINWIEIDAPGGYRIKTNAEPLSKNGVPQVMSFEQMIALAKANNSIPITGPISDARWAAASVKTIVPPVASKDGAHFNDPVQNAAFAASYGPLGTALRDGGHKEMVLARNLTPSGKNSMIFRGWRKANGTMWQSGQSSDHDRKWIEYDSYATLARRDATKNGQPVDLLAELQQEGPLAAPPASGTRADGTFGPLPPLPAFIVAELGGTMAAERLT